MQIPFAVRAVERLSLKLDNEISHFQQKTGLHCPEGCGACCAKNNIHTSPLEFLPFAFHAYLEDVAEKLYEELDEENPICHFFHPFIKEGMQGNCTNYQFRGLTCRLFGFSALVKKEKYTLYTCRRIKIEQPENYLAAEKNIQKKIKVPQVSAYYSRLASIDGSSGVEMYAINVAIKMALAMVLHYYSYRPKPKTPSAKRFRRAS